LLIAYAYLCIFDVVFVSFAVLALDDHAHKIIADTNKREIDFILQAAAVGRGYNADVQMLQRV